MLRYFSDIEFRYCDPPCSLGDMDSYFMQMLDNARHICKTPFVPTSAYRTEEYEIEQGRSGTSSHTKGIAIDLKAETSNKRYKIVNALLSTGFNRIGIGKNFIHVDLDRNKTQNVIWHYYGN